MNISATIPRFHPLTISDLRRESGDAISLAFAIPPDLADAYRFAPGQYLTLRTTMDGEEVRRSYSICSGPDDGELRIAVKKVDGGAFSVWATEELKAGDTIDVMTPTGRFGVAHAVGEVRTYVGFAAGSGITPILSLVKGVLARETASRFFLFYGNRTTDQILFRESLETLKDRYLDRFAVFHVLSQEEQDVPVMQGRLDRDKVRLLLTAMVPASSVDHVFVCGPTGMSDDVKAACRELGLAEERIHVERFVSGLGGKPRPKAVVAPGAPPKAIASLIIDGKRREVPVAEGEAILDAALRAGVDLPFACKGGMCSTCRAKLVEGQAPMELNYSLEPWELQAGFILTCQAKPTSDRVVVDYDHL
ncbi:1,2-phenylacetyl-CoA epoxidase subunit PaaE [Rhodopseudomonas pseudopalustris]|uniref:Ring-1,2-phenylacetyl-CoA epoxidase subunit PaaE n=1 Tax=Rhodopseudomonas pseudopalustris TaxID=1513892 RepID=A0A1H8RU37_9BRAD|nr:1,2-phenylacetyl-CoA epoxidase subunit PaaE [Rhodopseudomonas pseudopalustris]SEO69855.1 ring-1,2-phenylacetyl-CoA epoxidase subunit PaaE [Rhodopseudomonas pseudopalustris]